jgi:hypothetical protein
LARCKYFKEGEIKVRLKKGVLKSFNSGNYTGTVQLASSYKVYLEDISVARNLPSAEMLAGRKVAVVFFDESNPKEAVVVAVYT